MITIENRKLKYRQPYRIKSKNRSMSLRKKKQYLSQYLRCSTVAIGFLCTPRLSASVQNLEHN